MNEDRKRILAMLAEGKITAEEADMLLDSLGTAADEAQVAAPDPSPSADWPTGPSAGGTPKFMYVKVDSVNRDKVDVKVPLALLRTGLKLTSLIPPQAMEQINTSMTEAGMSFDLNNIKPEDIEDIIESLREMEVNVNSANGDKIRVFCA
jgi:hypothetical protein